MLGDVFEPQPMTSAVIAKLKSFYDREEPVVAGDVFRTEKGLRPILDTPEMLVQDVLDSAAAVSAAEVELEKEVVSSLVGKRYARRCTSRYWLGNLDTMRGWSGNRHGLLLIKTPKW